MASRDLSRGAELLTAWLKRTGTGHNELGRNLKLAPRSDFITKLVLGKRRPGREIAVKLEVMCKIPIRAWDQPARAVAA